MNIKTSACSLLAVLFMISCDNNTSGLGSSLIPDGDAIEVTADSCYAASRSIKAADSLVIMTSQCNLGRYTEPVSGSTFQAGYLTQLSCMESFNLPDSVYGIGNHTFPAWFDSAVADAKPYYAQLRIYYTGFFGDSTNTLKIEVFPLNRMIDANSIYYPDLDPSQFCDLSSKPIASITASADNFQNNDSIRSTSSYYPSITIPLPDTLAQRILESYYLPGGKEKFADATSFMRNIIKGFYIRCAQGDGTVLYIDRSVLELNFKYINYEDQEDPSMESLMAEFPGNSEVLQLNCFKWTGLVTQLNDNSCTWIRSPFGILTEITLPIDSMKTAGSVLNATQLCLSSANTPSNRYKPSVPSTVVLVRKELMQDFFRKNNITDDTESFAASYSSKYGTYTFNNIAALVEKAWSDRKEWLDDNNKTGTEADLAEYANSHPDWNKVVLIPVTPVTGTQSTVLSYTLDIKMHQVKLVGGANNKLKVKIIRSRF